MTPSGARSTMRSALLLLLGGCSLGDGVTQPADCPLPAISASAVRANPHNVLSAVVTARVQHADSVRVRFGLTGTPRDSVTPDLTASGDSVLVPVLGLLPETAYALEVVASSDCGHSTGPVLGLLTGALPSDLPTYRAGGSDPSPGFIVFAAGSYGLVIDNTGRIVWYRHFPGGPGLNFQAQPSGRYFARPNPAAPGDATPWVELSPLGDITRTLTCARGLQPRFHDLIAGSDGTFWVMCDETRVMDLSGLGGVAQAQVMGTVIQHLSPDGALLFEWNPFDHFRIEDLDPAERTVTSVNWTHGNALDLAADGHLLVSFRSLSEITKIDTRTGAVLWRMGGRANQFGFEGLTTPAFHRQHGVRTTGSSRLTLLDNLGELVGSRAESYQYDEASRTVRLIAAYAGQAGVTAQLGGTTQSLPGGRVLVSFGNGGVVEEYDAEGNSVWRIAGSAGYVFRAQRIRSLYHPGVGDPR